MTLLHVVQFCPIVKYTNYISWSYT